MIFLSHFICLSIHTYQNVDSYILYELENFDDSINIYFKSKYTLIGILNL